jgi:hypothetical protein
MAKKSLEEFSDAELRSEIARRATAAADEQIKMGKQQFDALEASAAELYGKLKGILNDASDEVREELTKHIKTLPDLTNITKGTSILKQQAKTPELDRRKEEKVIKEVEAPRPVAYAFLLRVTNSKQLGISSQQRRQFA